MMNIKRKYRMSDGRLADAVLMVLVGAMRDVAELEPYGWDEARLLALEQATMDFMKLPGDVELSSMMAEATDAKNAIRKQATDFVMVKVMARVAQKFDDGTPTYRRFRTGDIHNGTDAEFRLTLRRVARLAQGLLGELATVGLTQAMIDQVTAFATQFDSALEAQDGAVDERDMAVETRINAGNAIYAELVKLSDLGKRLWLNVNESLYNEYVLYPHQRSTKGKDGGAQLQVVEAEVAPGAVVNLSLTDFGPDTPLTAQNSGPGTLLIYFAYHPTDGPPESPPGTVVELTAGVTWTGTARQLGMALPGREYMQVHNPHAQAAHLEVTAG